MWAKQSTAATLIVGPILDSSGAEYASAVIGDLSISKNGGTLTALAAAATLTHIANGQYTLVMTTGNLDTLGRLQITCNKSTYQMPPIGLVVVPAMVFDSMVLGTDVLQSDVTQFGGTAGTFAAGIPTAALDSTSIMAIYNTMPDAGFVDGSMGDRWLISSSNQRTVAVTGSNHIAADVHNCQPDGLTDSTEIAAINTFATRVTTGIVQDGAVWQFTANMLELAPSSGGGSGDASQATLLAVKAKTDLIGTAAGATQLLAASVLEPGAITSFPETLRVGDSYTDVIGRGIQLPIVDTDGVALTSAGNKNFADAIATFVIKRANDTEPSRIITGTAVFVDPPGTGTGEAPYALIEIPSSETAKGLVKYRYTGLLTFTWPYVGTGTDAEVMTFETGTITFET